MKNKNLSARVTAWALALLLLALPALAEATQGSVEFFDNGLELWDRLEVLMPVPTDADEAAFFIIDDEIVQEQFVYDGGSFILRAQRTRAFKDVSGITEEIGDTAVCEEELDAYFECTQSWSDDKQLAWWYDAGRGVSYSLYAEGEFMAANFDIVREDILLALRRGAARVGNATANHGSFALAYPLIQTDDAATTAAINGTLASAANALCAAHASDAVFSQPLPSLCFIDGFALSEKRFLSIGWGGATSAPGAAYEPYENFSIIVDLQTGEALPLSALLDVGDLAQKFAADLDAYYLDARWEDAELNAAQKNELRQMSVADWIALLEQTDFPNHGESGLPSAFTRWAKSWSETNVLLNIPTAHAIGDCITLRVTWDTI